jgi:archaemetzincin
VPEIQISLFWTRDVTPTVLNHLQELLPMVFSDIVKPGGTFELKPDEFDPERERYLSTSILRRLRTIRPTQDFLLAVTEADLYAAGLNFVFGKADSVARCAIISLARLKAGYTEKPFTMKLFLRLALNEAVHEVGLLLGIGHCPQPACVMHFSNSLYDTGSEVPRLHGLRLAYAANSAREKSGLDAPDGKI